ncbi:UNVERIFIED_ORG: tetratricopeptide repeat protein [Shinella sp. XGS7]|nr:tetratricopeptide repeat protein [Shinella sp. XGS7]
MKPTALLCSLLLLAASAQAQDLDALWDYARPALSEQRFRAALVQARGDEALILQTQIARSLGLRRDFEGARALLLSLEPQLATAGPEARVRQALELGRSFISASHPSAQRTPEAREAARRAYLAALAEARAAGLDGLAVDALHMMAFVDSAPADQLRWNREALALAETSPQPAARRWRASLQNNLGLSLRELGRPQEALQAFQAALALREQEAPGSDGGSRLRIARWMVAHQLRLLGETEAALSQQLALEQACAAAGQPDPYVFEELEILYRARGDAERAAHYAQRRAGMPP